MMQINMKLTQATEYNLMFDKDRENLYTVDAFNPIINELSN